MEQKSNSKKDANNGFIIFEKLKGLDMYGAPIPSFNMRGESAVQTHAGGFISLVIFFVTTIFCLVKLADMIQRQNPAVTLYVQREAFGDGDGFDLKKENFQIAVALQKHHTHA